MKKYIGIIIHFIIRLIVYFALMLLTIFFDKYGIINSLILLPVLILLFEIVWLQIRHKNVNLFAIFREMSMAEILKTILTIVGSVVIFLGLIALTVLLLWKCSTPPQLQRQQYMNQFKQIYIANYTDEPVCAIINFRYTEEEMAKYHISIDENFISIDTFLLGKPHFQYDETSVYLPIKESDSIPFPQNFKVSILDSTCTSILCELNFDEFIALTKNEPVIKNNNPLTQEVWWLRLDSIIDLKATKKI